MKNVPHYTKAGKLYKGKTHKMSDGSLHTGATHTKNSQVLSHKKPKKKTTKKDNKKIIKLNHKLNQHIPTIFSRHEYNLDT